MGEEGVMGFFFSGVMSVCGQRLYHTRTQAGQTQPGTQPQRLRFGFCMVGLAGCSFGGWATVRVRVRRGSPLTYQVQQGFLNSCGGGESSVE